MGRSRGVVGSRRVRDAIADRGGGAMRLLTEEVVQVGVDGWTGREG